MRRPRRPLRKNVHHPCRIFRRRTQNGLVGAAKSWIGWPARSGTSAALLYGHRKRDRRRDAYPFAHRIAPDEQPFRQHAFLYACDPVAEETESIRRIRRPRDERPATEVL